MVPLFQIPWRSGSPHDVLTRVQGFLAALGLETVEAFPEELQTLFPQYRDAYNQGQNFLNLTLVPEADSGLATPSRPRTLSGVWPVHHFFA